MKEQVEKLKNNWWEDIELKKSDINFLEEYVKNNKDFEVVHILVSYYRDEKNVEKFGYYCNIFGEKEYYDAKKFFMKFLFENDDEAARKLEQLNLSFLNKCFAQKYISCENYDKAIEFFKKEADKGDKEVLIKLGSLYKEVENYKLSFEYFKKAADGGDIRALFDIANMYEYGRGVEKNETLAFKYYKIAADNGDADAMFRVADSYFYGSNGVEENYKLAFKYYKKSIKTGIINYQSLRKIGHMYEYGKGVEQNYKMALKCFKDAYDEVMEYELDDSGDITFGIKESINDVMFKLNSNTDFDYKDMFEIYKRNCPKDKYINKLKSKIDEGASVIDIEKFSDLTVDKLNQISDDSIVFIRDNQMYLYQDFYIGKDIKKIVKICSKILKNIDLNQEPEDIFMQIYIKLSCLISYDDDAVKKNENNHSEEKISSSRNMLPLISKTGVCAGYANILRNILSLAGIDCTYISSNSHSYNQVKIGDKWYYCDLTWDSKNIRSGDIHYCLKSKEEFIRKYPSSKYLFLNESSMEEVNKNHVDLPSSNQYEANESYENIDDLFMNNLMKLNDKDSVSFAKITADFFDKRWNSELAIKYYKIAADNGDCESLFKLAELYRSDDNFQLAFEYYRKASMKGNTNASIELGIMYEFGFHVKKDYDLAYQYFMKALMRNNFVASVYLGNMYERGHSVERNYQDAYAFFKNAADHGILYAKERMFRLFKTRKINDDNVIDFLNNYYEDLKNTSKGIKLFRSKFDILDDDFECEIDFEESIGGKSI